MTKEELEKEAREKFRQKYNCYPRNKSWFTEGYLASAEPREKQIEIDAEQIRALQKQNGELADELAKKADTNHQLVEQMAKLSEENAELKQAKEGKVVEHFEAYGQCRDSRRIAELEKENAELKELLEDKSCLDCKHLHSDLKLTKAKEYIKLLLINCVGVYESTGKTIAEIQAEAEQFLNSEVEK